MPRRLEKHGKEHIGVINLDLKLDSLKRSAGLRGRECRRHTQEKVYLDWLG